VQRDVVEFGRMRMFEHSLLLSETSDQCHLAGVMLPPPLCTILCDYQQSKVVDQIEGKKKTLLLLLLLNFLRNLMKQQ